jgi:hypothetical protein
LARRERNEPTRDTINPEHLTIRNRGKYAGSLIAARIRDHSRVSDIPYNLGSTEAKQLAAFLGLPQYEWKSLHGREVEGVRVEILRGY